MTALIVAEPNDSDQRPEPDPNTGTQPERVSNARRQVPRVTRSSIPEGLEERDYKLAVYLEARMMQVVRHETRDPYAGLPADDVLDRLDKLFPDVGYPERMMRRLETEQTHRHMLESESNGLAKYQAETMRIGEQHDRDLVSSTAKRAERVVYVLVAAGLLCVFTHHVNVGLVILGTTLVGVASAFLTQRLSWSRKGTKK